MADLSPHDKRRIQDEERYREEVRESYRRRSPWRWLGFGCAGLVLVFITGTTAAFVIGFFSAVDSVIPESTSIGGMIRTRTPTSALVPTRIPTPAPTLGPTATPTPTPTPHPTPTPLALVAMGDSVSGPFDLKQGLTFLDITHDGDRYFGVRLVSEDGRDSDLTVNEIGAYEGTRVHRVDNPPSFALNPGLYRVEVQADGNWTIELTQPTLETSEQLAPASGHGDDVVGPFFSDSGTFPLAFTHDGDSNFIVHALSADGKNSQALINLIGQYEGTVLLRVRSNTALGLGPGIHLIAVQADGNWTMEVRE